MYLQLTHSRLLKAKQQFVASFRSRTYDKDRSSCGIEFDNNLGIVDRRSGPLVDDERSWNSRFAVNIESVKVFYSAGIFSFV